MDISVIILFNIVIVTVIYELQSYPVRRIGMARYLMLLPLILSEKVLPPGGEDGCTP